MGVSLAALPRLPALHVVTLRSQADEGDAPRPRQRRIIPSSASRRPHPLPARSTLAPPPSPPASGLIRVAPRSSAALIVWSVSRSPRPPPSVSAALCFLFVPALRYPSLRLAAIRATLPLSPPTTRRRSDNALDAAAGGAIADALRGSTALRGLSIGLGHAHVHARTHAQTHHAFRRVSAVCR